MDGGWALTNLMLYSSSHVGILGGIIEETEVEAILRLDLLKTDYYHHDAYPTYLYYNPHDTEKSVGFTLPAGSFDLYDAIANASMNSGVTGSTSIPVPPKQAVMLVLYPSDSLVTQSGKKTLAGKVVIDFNNGATVTDIPPRMKALVAENNIIEAGKATRIYCTASDPEQGMLAYEWIVDGESVDGTPVYEFQPPAVPGFYQILCKVTDPGNQWDTLSAYVEVVEKITDPPEILRIEAEPLKVHLSGTIELRCIARDINNDTLSYVWSAVAGNLTANDELATYTAPDLAGNYSITCVVSDTDLMTDTDSIEVMVRRWVMIAALGMPPVVPLVKTKANVSVGVTARVVSGFSTGRPLSSIRSAQVTLATFSAEINSPVAASRT